jgi:hypothetical protein
MTCSKCVPLCATTEAILANRLKRMAETPSATVHPCPHCGGIDWATSREQIKAEPKRRGGIKLNQQSWRRLRMFNIFTGVLFLGFAAWDGISLIGMFDTFLVGFNFAMALACTMQIRMRKSFDDMVERNQALLENKVVFPMFHEPDGDVPPTAPTLR